MIEGKVLSLSDGIALIDNMHCVGIHSTVLVGKSRIQGTVIAVNGDTATVHLFDNWQTVLVGDRVVSENIPLSVELGPGLIGQIFDALLRPIGCTDKSTGALSRRRRWGFLPQKCFGDRVAAGDIIGYVSETPSVRHAVTVRAGLCGTVVELNNGYYCVTDRIGKIKKDDGTIVDLTLLQYRGLASYRAAPRTLSEYRSTSAPLLCGLLATDAFFPIEKGSVALIAGDTSACASNMLARLTLSSTADVNVVVLCGKSLNVIYSRLGEYKASSAYRNTVFILSPQSDRYEMRIKSLETGFAVAEYFRDMGLDVLLSFDSLDAILELEPANASLVHLTGLLSRATSVQMNGACASLTFAATVSHSLIASADQIKQKAWTYISLCNESQATAKFPVDIEDSFSKAFATDAAAKIALVLTGLSRDTNAELAVLAQNVAKALLNADFFATRAKTEPDAQTFTSAEQAFLDKVLSLCRDAEERTDDRINILRNILTLCNEINIRTKRKEK